MHDNNKQQLHSGDTWKPQPTSWANWVRESGTGLTFNPSLLLYKMWAGLLDLQSKATTSDLKPSQRRRHVFLNFKRHQKEGWGEGCWSNSAPLRTRFSWVTQQLKQSPEHSTVPKSQTTVPKSQITVLKSLTRVLNSSWSSRDLKSSTTDLKSYWLLASLIWHFHLNTLFIIVVVVVIISPEFSYIQLYQKGMDM